MTAAPPPPGWTVWLDGLLPEERRGRPGAALAEVLDAARKVPEYAHTCYLAAACLALSAGEPLRSISYLNGLTGDVDVEVARQAEAIRLWATASARNLYPGDICAERPRSLKFTMPSALEAPTDNRDTALLESLAVQVCMSLLPLRGLLDNPIIADSGSAAAMGEQYRGVLATLILFAPEWGSRKTALWAMQARADVARRMGDLDSALAELRAARVEAEAVQDSVAVAQSWLREGDWYLTPGSAPEMLGLRLEDESSPAFSFQRNDDLASEAYRRASKVLANVDAPRSLAALQLRLALIAAREGRTEDQVASLEAAEAIYSDAGDAAGRWIARVHHWLADLQRGMLRKARVLAPLEWSDSHGELQELIEWATTVGSPSLAAGLGRLLHRRASGWIDDGLYEQAELALRMARPLLPLNGAIPDHAVPEILAKLDTLRGLNTRALVRRIQVLDRLPPPPDPAADVQAWIEDVSLTTTFVTIPTGLNGTGKIVVDLISRGASRLAMLISRSNLARSDLPSAAQDPRELQRRFSDRLKAAPDIILQQLTSDDVPEHSREAFLQTAAIAQETLDIAAPLASLMRARDAQQRGWDDQAEAWFADAHATAAALPHSARWVEVLVLQTWDRPDQSRAAWDALSSEVGLPEPLRACLAVRAGRGDAAYELLTKFPAPGPERAAGRAWQEWLSLGEAALAAEDFIAASESAQKGIADLEAWLASLVREAERIDACDDINVALLYQIAARAALAMADKLEAETQGQQDSIAEYRRESFSIIDRQRSLLLPTIETPDGISDPAWRRWQGAAIEHTAAYQRMLAELLQEESHSDSAKAEDTRNALASSERRLAEIEAALDDDELGAIRKARSIAAQAVSGAVEALQKRLPAKFAVFEVSLIGRELVAFLVTSHTVHPHYERVGRRIEGTIHRLLKACAEGACSEAIQEDAEFLSKTLLAPFPELLTCDRLVIVANGPLQVLPWHLLPFSGEPLGTKRAISMLSAASLLMRDDIDRPLSEGPKLIVGDPAFDAEIHPELRRLPGAALEAHSIKKLYAEAIAYTDSQATEDALRPLMANGTLLHLAAHGRIDDISPYSSSIILSGADELTVADLAGLDLRTDLVVLSACDTGRGTATLGGDLLGLGRGLLAAGAKRYIVSLWPVDDAAACVAMVAVHRWLAEGLPPARALERMQEEIRGLDAVALRDRYLMLGGHVEDQTKRTTRGRVTRELAPYSEVDDDGFTPDDKPSGSDPAIWAAFVLIGC